MQRPQQTRLKIPPHETGLSEAGRNEPLLGREQEVTGPTGRVQQDGRRLKSSLEHIKQLARQAGSSEEQTSATSFSERYQSPELSGSLSV